MIVFIDIVDIYCS